MLNFYLGDSDHVIVIILSIFWIPASVLLAYSIRRSIFIETAYHIHSIVEKNIREGHNGQRLNKLIDNERPERLEKWVLGILLISFFILFTHIGLRVLIPIVFTGVCILFFYYLQIPSNSKLVSKYLIRFRNQLSWIFFLQTSHYDPLNPKDFSRSGEFLSMLVVLNSLRNVRNNKKYIRQIKFQYAQLLGSLPSEGGEYYVRASEISKIMKKDYGIDAPWHYVGTGKTELQPIKIYTDKIHVFESLIVEYIRWLGICLNRQWQIVDYKDCNSETGIMFKISIVFKSLTKDRILYYSQDLYFTLAEELSDF